LGKFRLEIVFKLQGPFKGQENLKISPKRKIPWPGKVKDTQFNRKWEAAFLWLPLNRGLVVKKGNGPTASVNLTWD